MGAEKVFTGLPTWAQGIIAVGSLGIIGLVGYKIYSKVTDKIKHANDYKAQEDVKKDLQILSDKNIIPSFTNSQYSAWANQIFGAMDGYGTDTASIASILGNLKNNADVLKLIDTYGVRELSSGKYNPTPNFKGTLPASLTEEMEFIYINIINNALAKKGITIRF